MAKRIAVGDKVPDVTLMYNAQPEKEGICSAPKPVKTSELFAGKKVVLFGVPGAFTPLCHNTHLPSYLTEFDVLKTKGVDVIACISTADVFVQDAWGKAENVGSKILMLSDGNGEFVTKAGLSTDMTKFRFGPIRSQRFALIAEDGVVKHIAVDGPKYGDTDAKAIVAKL
ncbi:putative peroxiredoxin [Gonapodya prolifera JEL478]|uniref:Thioredoxin-dependent peroxiredoxin n=1 Tax=Gonapodya prolifera (strain JEL478) TaxID=1344416 RepID=A0A139A2Q9_GONPJ|nr:putative peroxiredoxin [Gonapodya prolifera JEL478]|eukprot:KXS11024.1 putative peroxiredoxin [Gonapodya prolifera JEL478]